MKTRNLGWGLAGWMGWFGGLAFGAEVVLLDPARPEHRSLDRWRVADATVEPVEVGGSRGMKVTTGVREPWPGATYTPATDAWNLAPHAAVFFQLRNVGQQPTKIFARVDNPGADGTRHCVTGDLTLAPGQVGRLRVDLRRTTGGTLGGKLFGMRGYPATAGGAGTIDPARINQVLLFVDHPKASHAWVVERVVAEGEYTPPTAWVTDADPYFPFIDRFGQYRHRSWPGKVNSEADLIARRAEEEKEWEARTGPRDWDRYGGWASGPQLEATGFFRVQKHAGKWWLVDPEGRLFWSHGVNCVRMLDLTPVESREHWFESFAEWSPEFAGRLPGRGRVLMGHYAGRTVNSFSFAGANLLRKYGNDWKPAYADVVHRRLRGWAMNTIANWSDREVTALRRTPYTDSLQVEGVRMIEGSEGYWGKFPDVFDAGFERQLRRQVAAKQGKSAGDPWCLGYFSDNELAWGDELSLALAALRSPADQPAKLAFWEDLKTRYGAVERLNEVWGTAHATWEALREARGLPDVGKARGDLERFYTRTAETYFRTVRDVLREGAPGQLYLGCRFAWVNARAAAAAGRYCDVVSYNLYQRSVAEFVHPGGADVPLLIGEFHFGALDRGMFHTGLVPVADQRARAKAYRDYVEGALRHARFVGTHWFQWQDEPTTGRVWDEENYQIGLVDIADTPYRETVDAVRSVGENLYRLRMEAP